MLKEGAGGHEGELVRSGNAMAELAAASAMEALADGRYFVIENPGGSWLWSLPCMVELAGMAGVRRVVLNTCAFGSSRRKWTALLTNIPELEDECHRECHAWEQGDPCDFTGQLHESWIPGVEGNSLGLTKTKLEEEYQPELCEAMSRAFMKRLEHDPRLAECAYAFLEVFSGPNAPLTGAMRKACAATRGRKGPGPEAATAAPQVPPNESCREEVISRVPTAPAENPKREAEAAPAPAGKKAKLAKVGKWGNVLMQASAVKCSTIRPKHRSRQRRGHPRRPRVSRRMPHVWEACVHHGSPDHTQQRPRRRPERSARPLSRHSRSSPAWQRPPTATPTLTTGWRTSPNR